MSTRGSEGPATDKLNDPVIDPTKNVLDLVAAAIARQDDLRNLESRWIRRSATTQAKHSKALRKAETKRINAIRAVDVAAVQRASEVAAVQASALAAQVTASAEALRTQVAATATAGTIALGAALEPMQKDIQDLRRAQYEAQGQKTQVIESTTKSGSIGLWIGIAVAAIGAGFSMLIGLAGIAFGIITYITR